MPISGIGQIKFMSQQVLFSHSERYKEHGFTLIEVLVVVFIVAMASTVIIISLPNSEKKTVVHAENLLRELTLASRESIASGHPTALFFTDDGYAFRHFREREWSKNLRSTKVRSDDRFSQTRLGLYLEDGISTVEDLESQPVVTFYPIGDATPASLIIEGEGPTLYVNVMENAKIEILDRISQ